MNKNTKMMFENSEWVETQSKKLDEFLERQNEKFTKAKDMISNDCKPIDEMELVKESNDAIQKYAKYSMVLMDEQRQLTIYNTKLTEREMYLIDYYKFNYDKSTKMTDSMCKKYAEAHPLYAKLNELVENHKNYIAFLIHTLEYFKTKNFTIKNMIELRKIDLGM